MLPIRFFNRRAASWAVAGLILGAPVVAPTAAVAQTIVLSVNGDPVTTIDIEQRMKLLRVLKKPATREAAVENLIIERLKTHEIAKYTVHLTDADIGQEISRTASDMKEPPNTILAELQRAGLTPDQYKSYFGTIMGYNLLIQALNKGVEASESDIRAELAKAGGKAAAGMQYTLRQVIVSVPFNATPAIVQARAHLAEDIRGRFTSCETGTPMARGMEDTAVLDPIYRNSNQLADQFRTILDKTPVGHLTPPERGSSGIEMVAICDKSPSNDDTAIRTQISNRLMRARLEADAAARVKDMRDHAVIVKMNGGAVTER